MTHHVKDYIKMTGKPLGRTTDQTTEVAHQYLNKRMTLSNYYIKDIQSHSHSPVLAVNHRNWGGSPQKVAFQSTTCSGAKINKNETLTTSGDGVPWAQSDHPRYNRVKVNFQRV